MAWIPQGEIRVYKHEPDPESPWPGIILIVIIIGVIVSCCDDQKKSSARNPQQSVATQVYQSDRGR